MFSIMIPIIANEVLFALLMIIDIFILFLRHILSLYFKNEINTNNSIHPGFKYRTIGTFAVKFVDLMRA